MESRRFSGNNHWYHETLATGRADTRPLMPEAATVVDPFLLGADDNAAAPLCLLLNQQQAKRGSTKPLSSAFPGACRHYPSAHAYPV